jgi:uncharacterized protein YraI
MGYQIGRWIFSYCHSKVGPWFLIFQFYDNFTDGRTPWTSDHLVARPLPKHRTTQTQNKHTYQTSVPCVGFEPTILASERAKTVRGYRDRHCEYCIGKITE